MADGDPATRDHLARLLRVGALHHDVSVLLPRMVSLFQASRRRGELLMSRVSLLRSGTVPLVIIRAVRWIWSVRGWLWLRKILSANTTPTTRCIQKYSEEEGEEAISTALCQSYSLRVLHFKTSPSNTIASDCSLPLYEDDLSVRCSRKQWSSTGGAIGRKLQSRVY